MDPLCNQEVPVELYAFSYALWLEKDALAMFNMLTNLASLRHTIDRPKMLVASLNIRCSQ